MRAVLVHYIDEGYYSAEELNERVQCFDYGYSETDKPAPRDGYVL